MILFYAQSDCGFHFVTFGRQQSNQLLKNRDETCHKIMTKYDKNIIDLKLLLFEVS